MLPDVVISGRPVANAKALVLGMARSGVAAASLLAQAGATVTMSDARPIETLPEAAALGLPFTPQHDAVALGHDLVVTSPGVPVDAPPLAAARAAGIPVIGEMELAFRYLRGPVLAVTGSNGKTTTTAACGHILEAAGIPAQVGGNIGRAAASMVASSRDGQWNVLEVSSFQLETVDLFHPRIAACLNITPNHLDRHGSIDVYRSMKQRLFARQQSADTAVLNYDDASCRAFAESIRSKPVWFSQNRDLDAWAAGGEIWLEGELLAKASELQLRGEHNVQNLMAAALACSAAGASHAAIAGAIRTFKALPHRLEFTARIAGVDWFNDSKATSVDATRKALEAFHEPVWLILGGKGKGASYRPLRDYLGSRPVLLIGEDAPAIARDLDGAAPIRSAGTLEEAVLVAAAESSPGDVVLLSPACASFDQFQSYEHRGDRFKSLVHGLENTQ